MQGLTEAALTEVQTFRALRLDLQCPACDARYAFLRTKTPSPDSCSGSVLYRHGPTALVPYPLASTTA